MFPHISLSNNRSNWMRRVCPADDASKANVLLVSIKDQVGKNNVIFLKNAEEKPGKREWVHH